MQQCISRYYLALSHGTGDLHAEAAVSQATAVYDRATAPLLLRPRAQIARFFTGFDLVDPDGAGTAVAAGWPAARPP